MLVNSKHYRTVWMESGKVRMINQLLLPHRFEIADFSDYSGVAESIRNMTVRGAGAIGATGAFGVAIAALNAKRPEDIAKAADVLRKTRPTAQNLFTGIEYVMNSISGLKNMDEIKKSAVSAAQRFADYDAESCRKIGEFGSALIKDGFRISTHCNAGWLAFVDWGSALSPVYAAKRQGKKLFVFADETRPRCQGAMLTAWELVGEKIPHVIIVDNATGHYMKSGEIDMVIVGSDRISANGDVANKIGTYEKAVVAKENGIPFYVAAPTTTIDWNCNNGNKIPIEERGQEEVLFVQGLGDDGKIRKVRIAPQGSAARNPAFDVTPAKYVKGIITESGIFRPSELSGLKKKSRF